MLFDSSSASPPLSPMQSSRPIHHHPFVYPWVRPGGLGLALLLGLAFPLNAQSRPPRLADGQYRLLSVTGQGVENLQTTAAQVRLGVEVQGKTAEGVQKQVARRSAAILSLLKSRQVEKLETTGINLSPTYNNTNGQRRLMGYRGSNIVSFRTDIAKAGALMDDAVQTGASRIDRVSFVATETAIAAAQQQALTQATQDAQAQAKTVLSALNLTPKDVISVQINGANTPAPPPIPFPATTARSREGVTTPVVGGEQSVRASVTLHIQY